MKRKLVLVTGGAKGIGKAISKKLASENWDLILWGRDEKVLREYAGSLEHEYPCKVLTSKIDLSNLDAISEQFQEMKRDGIFPNAIVCNAGDYGTLGNLKDIDLATWKRSFDLNFFAAAALIQNYCRLIEDRTPERRSILLLSGSGLGSSKVWPGISAYACAKSAIYRLMECVHEESHKSLGIDINCLAPGAVKTGITDQAVHAGEGALGALFESTLKVIASGGDSPELAANMAAKLLEDSCTGISGRLISAKWDTEFLEPVNTLIEDQDMFRLRRIDKSLFVKKMSMK